MKKIRKLIKWSCILLVLGILGIWGMYGYAKLTPKIVIKSANSIFLYDNEEQVFFQGNGSSEWINLDKVSDYVINATIATEDKKFFRHQGFDYLRVLKAIYENIKTGTKSQGASTITQQYARNLFLSMDKTWERKIKEAWITFELETHYSKEEILEGYLNTINYGHGIYGIENAAKFYFNKSSADLTLAEATIISGIPNSPANYSPISNYEKSKERQNIVLNSMIRENFITEEEKKEAYETELIFHGKKETLDLATLMYYQNAVMKELNSIQKIPSSYLEVGGLKVYTSLDIKAQTILEEKQNINLEDNPDIQVASVLMEPNTGRVIALTGGRDYSVSQYNRAIQSKRQVGSTMKPFLYYSALENGFTASSSFISEPTTFTFSDGKTYSPGNFADKYADKSISMAAAISYSDNIFAVKTHLFLGEDNLVDMAKRVGIDENLQPIASLPLGSTEINIMEMVGAYGTFANEGYKVTPHLIVRVEDMNGKILYEAKEEKENVLNKSITFILNEMLAGTYDKMLVDYNTPTCLSISPKMSRKYAVKSGSTNNDVWVFGYNPNLVLGIWSGYDENGETESRDSINAKNIWIDTLENYLPEDDDAWYEIPNNVVGVLVNPITGELATENDIKKKILYYIKGTEPYYSDVNLDEVFQQNN